MKIGKYEVSLARQAAPKVIDKEQGSSGGKATGYFDTEVGLGRVRNPNIQQIMDMIDNDGTVQGLYNFITFPVLATDWHIRPDPEDVVSTTDANGNVTESHPQADFIDDCLRNPEHKGGMSTPFSLVIADMLLAVAQGYRFFEIVYKLNEAGQIVLKKVVSREAKDIELQTDATGGFAGVKQHVKDESGGTKTVLIELPYCLLYTYRKERNKLKGASALRSAFYHYDKKHRLYFLQNQQAQVNAMAFKVLDAPDGALKEARDENLEAVDKMAVRPSIALPFGWKLNIAQPARGMDLQGYIDGHDIQMARSTLAQGMMQGNSSQSSGGSYSLGEIHFDTFMLGELALMAGLEEHITGFLISKLIDYNFDKPLYPEFHFNPLADEVATLLQEGFKSLVAKGAVPKWVANGISNKVAQRMEIDKPEADGASADDNDYIGITNTPTNPALDRHQHSKKKVTRFSAGDWWRDLTAVEAKVKFAKIQKQADDAEESLLDDLKPIFDKLATDTGDRLEPLLQGKDPIKAMDGFTLNFADEVRDVFAEHMLSTYGDAKKQAADEINKKAPANKPASKDLINQHAQSIVDKQFSDLLFSLKGVITDAVRKNLLARTQLGWRDVLATAVDIFPVFFDDKEVLTASSLITLALNLGRDDVFQEYSDNIDGYQYSAILDDVVCAICEELDSSVATPDEYYNTIWMPPIHFNCRCIWVAIMDDEEDKPDFTGIPSTPGGADAPSLSYEHNGVKYDIFLSKESAKLWQQKRS